MWNVICSNRYLQRKMRQESHRRHRDSLRNAKPLVDMEPPATFAFLVSNPKKAQIQQQQLREIQLANTDLLRRMATSCKKDLSFTTHPQKHSLHQAYSKRVSLAINKENQKLLQRLRDTPSLINFSKLEREHQLTQRLKGNITKIRPASGNSTKRSHLRPQSAR